MIDGGEGGDVILGGSGRDTLNGGLKNDVLVGGQGNDTLDGGEGADIAVFLNPYSNYEIQTSDKLTFTVKPNLTTILDGEDTLKNIETLQFSDVLVSLPDLVIQPLQDILFQETKNGLASLLNIFQGWKNLADGLLNSSNSITTTQKTSLSNEVDGKSVPLLGELSATSQQPTVLAKALQANSISSFSTEFQSVTDFISQFPTEIQDKIDGTILEYLAPVKQLLTDTIGASVPQIGSAELVTFLGNLWIQFNSLNTSSPSSEQLKQAFLNSINSTFPNNTVSNLNEDVFLENVYSSIKDNLNKLEGKLFKPIQQAIFDAIGPNGLDILKDNSSSEVQGQVELSDVNLDTSSPGIIKFDLNLGKEKTFSTQIDKNIGIPALGLNVNGGAQVKLDANFDLGFGLNLGQGTALPEFFFDISDPNELSLDLTASLLPSSNVEGHLGVLSVKANDAKTDPSNPNSPGTNITASFSVDLKNGSEEDNQLTLPELGKLTATPSWNLSGNLNLDLQAGFDSDPNDKKPYTVTIGFPNNFLNGKQFDLQLPTIEAGLRLHWDKASGLDGFRADQSGFKNVNLNLGKSIANTLGPIVSQVQPIFDPIKKITGLLTEPITFLEDLKLQSLLDVYPGPSGDGKITLIDLGLGLVTDQKKRENFTKLADIITTVDNIADFVSQLDVGSSTEDLRLPIIKDGSPVEGSSLLNFKTLGITQFTDLSTKKDLFTSNGTANQYITKLKGYASNIKDAFKSEIQNWEKEQRGTVKYKTSQFLDKGKGKLDFPIFTNPASALPLLFGQDVRIFTFDIPTLSAGLDFDTNIRIWGPIVATFGGSLGVNLDFGVGYDTHGLANFLKGPKDNISDPGDRLEVKEIIDSNGNRRKYNGILEVFDGFYLRDWKGDTPDTDINEITLTGELRAGAGLDVVVAAADVFGRILATLGLDLNDVINPDGELRGSEIASLIEYNPFCLFNLNGNITAGFGARVKVGWGPFSYTKRWDSPTVSLLKFNASCEFNPNKLAQALQASSSEPPILAISRTDGALLLYMGPEAANRKYIGEGLIDEEFTVTPTDTGFTVTAFGSSNSQQFALVDPKTNTPVTKIVADGGDGRDTIDVTAVAIPAELHGGDGTDSLAGGSQADLLEGGNGGDLLKGNDGNDTLEGGSGNDNPEGGKGDDTYLYDLTRSPNPGQDTITETDGEGTDKIEIVGVQTKDYVRAVRSIDSPKDLRLYFGDSKDPTTDNFVTITDQYREDGTPTAKVESTTLDSSVGPTDLRYGLRFVGSDYKERPDRMAGTSFSDTLEGRGGNDLLKGEAGDDSLDGGAGDDVLIGGAGADTFNGGAGFDVVSYETAPGVVKVDLRLAQQPEGSGDATGDSFFDSIEQITGSDFEDVKDSTVGDVIVGYLDKPNVLYGGKGGDSLTGGDKNDLLIGGSGNDTLDGGDGVDSTSYDNSEPGEINVTYETAVIVNLAAGTATGQEGKDRSFTDTLINIENVEGTETGNDTLKGNDRANILRGLGGDDLLEGAEGDDTLLGGTGQNTLIGGSNNEIGDTASYADYLKAPGNTEEVTKIGVFATLQENSLIAQNLNSGQHGVPREISQTREGKTLAQSYGLDRVPQDQTGRFGVAGGDTTDFGKLSIFVNQLGDLPESLTTEALQQTLFGALNDLGLLKSIDSSLIQETNGQSVVSGLVGKQGEALSSALTDVLKTLDTQQFLRSVPKVQDVLDKLGISQSQPSQLDPSERDAKVQQLTQWNEEQWQSQLLSALSKLGVFNLDYFVSQKLTKLNERGYLKKLPTTQEVLETNTLSFGLSESQLANFDTAQWEAKLLTALTETTPSSLNLDKFISPGLTNQLLGIYRSQLSQGAISRDAIRTALESVALDKSENPNEFQQILKDRYSLAIILTTDDVLDRIQSIENLDGSRYNDVLEGDDTANRLVGNSGNDYLIGGAGQDWLYGDFTPEEEKRAKTENASLTQDDISLAQGDRDVASYETLTQGVKIELSEPGTGGFVTLTATDRTTGDLVDQDKLKDIEQINGTYFADQIIGNEQNNILNALGAKSEPDTTLRERLEGKGGNDTFIANASFEDFDGGTGADTVDYSLSPQGVKVDLSQPDQPGLAGYAAGDTYTDTESITGSEKGEAKFTHPDDPTKLIANWLIGNEQPNTLIGGIRDDLIYGRAGNDTLTGKAGNDEIEGEEGDDWFSGGTGTNILKGGAGNDTVSYTEYEKILGETEKQSAQGLFATLATTSTLPQANGKGQFAYAGRDTNSSDDNIEDTYDDGIENIQATSYNDTLEGSNVANKIWGYGGNDEIYGLAGNDELYADVGNDVVWGHAGNDLLDGDVGKDTLYGGDNDDTLVGGADADSLDGGDGTDLASYKASPGSVTVNLTTGKGLRSHAEGDTLTKIENLEGSNVDDRKPTASDPIGVDDELMGDGNPNLLIGLGGDDLFEGGAGADTIYGGDPNAPDKDQGSDTASYEHSPAAVKVNLETGQTSGGDAQDDQLFGIENLKGSAYDDELVGNAVANKLWGGDGKDSITAGPGNDWIDAGPGDDIRLDGGEGSDEIHGGSGSDYIFGDFVGTGPSPISTAMQGEDTLYGEDGNDILLGNGRNDTLWGGTGNDLLNGGQGDDWLSGGQDNDTLFGEEGNDQLFGEIGDDTLVGYAGNDTLEGGDGKDYLGGMEGDDSLKGGQGNDIIVAAEGNDALDGGEGNDILEGDEGNDFITGGLDNDKIEGGDGDDMLWGDQSTLRRIDLIGTDDTQLSPQLKAYIPSVKGNDPIVGFNGTDIGEGFGDGTNELVAFSFKFPAPQSIQSARLILELTPGNSQISTDELLFADNFSIRGENTSGAKLYGNEILKGLTINARQTVTFDLSKIDTKLERPLGPSENLLDLLKDGELNVVYADDAIIHNARLEIQETFQSAGGGNDTINGGNGNDTIDGGDGDDIIDSGDGDDIVIGSLGLNTIKGGAGTDTASYLNLGERLGQGIFANLYSSFVQAIRSDNPNLPSFKDTIELTVRVIQIDYSKLSPSLL